MASAAARRSPRDQREVGRLDRDVGAGADRQAEVGLGERRRVVHAVADHRHDPALVLQPPDDRRLVRRQHLGDHLVDADLRPRPLARSRSLSPVSSTGRSPRRLQLGDRRPRLVGLTVSATDEHRPAPRRPSRPAPRCGRCPRPARGRRRASPGIVEAPLGQQPLAADEHEPVAVDASPRRRGPRGWRRRRRRAAADLARAAASAIARAIGCSDASSTAPTRRSASARSTPSASDQRRPATSGRW